MDRVFHVKQTISRDNVVAEFVRLCVAWNKTHRIIGGDPLRLLEQSEEAWINLLDVRKGFTHFVDVGAGSGVAGVPLLWIDSSAQIAFVEPDAKKASFLLEFGRSLSVLGRIKVVADRVEIVSRETVVGLSSGATVMLFARAFSGSKSLQEVAAASEFSSDAWFCFEEKNNHFNFAPLKII
jgi:16S rRNA G527 N7-methylase RsmG